MIRAHKENWKTESGSQYRPFLKHEIEDAIKNTVSMKRAAIYLNVSYPTFRRWAKYYGLWKPVSPKAIKKNRTAESIPLQDIFDGKHPNYHITKLKDRLIRAGIKAEECELCGYNHYNPLSNKVPLTIYYLDGNRKNMALENIQLRCYNCLYVTSDKPRPVYGVNFKRRTDEDMKNHFNLTEEELQELHDEIVRDFNNEEFNNGIK
jgi:hypothetical protein